MLIYKATVNRKSYIGKTINSFNIRLSHHKSCVNKKKSKIYFHCSIRKYGWDKVKWEILEDDITDFEYLKKREQFYIKKYNTLAPNGYNLTIGGDGTFGYKHTKETKRKVSLHHHNVKGNNNPMYGKNHSQKTKEKISKGRMGKYAGENNSFFGRKHTSKAIEKMRKARLKYYKNLT